MTRPPGVWINGELCAANEAGVAYDDHGLTVGDGVFETMKLVDGTPFARTRHLARLRRSAKAVAIEVPGDETIDGAIAAVCASGDGTGFLRITLTSGSGPLASHRGEEASTLIVAIRPGSLRTEPTAAFLAPWTRNERGALAGVKSTSYGDNVVALRYAERLGGSEAIFANTEGLLCEGTGSNIFFGLGGKLFTPSLSSGCLAGVTRELLLEAGVGTEADFHVDDLESATEIFLTSTSREVQPLATFGGRALPLAPGPLTAAARRVWLEQIATQLDP